MKITLIGSGNAATQFGNAFKRAGITVAMVYSRTAEHARTLADMLQCDFTTDVKWVISSGADAYVSTLCDDAALSVWKQIPFGDTPVFHTAGSMPMGALAPFAKHYGVLYPLQTLTKTRILDFHKVPLYLEWNDETSETILKSIASAVSENVRCASSEQRRKIHLAAVFANNFSNHMFALANELMQENGFNFEDLLPLIDETAQKVHLMPPLNAQTGPARRNDVKIMSKHQEMLKDHQDMLEVYRLISESIHNFDSKKN